MADPFSIVAGTVGLLDVCFRIGNYLYDAKKGANRVDEGIEALSHQIEAIQSVTRSIKNVFDNDLAYTPDTLPNNFNGIQSLWAEVAENVTSCQATLAELFALLKLIVGKEHATVLSKLDGLRRYLRKQAKEDEFGALRHRLSDYHHALQTLLTSVNIVITKNVQSTSDRSFAQISEEIRHFRLSLESQIASLRTSNTSSANATLRRTLELAEAVIPVASPNLYFQVPQSARSIFTGRRSELARLAGSLLPPKSSHRPHLQKRFVIFGLGGSGKTELCRKFAQENRHCFWGIFWIDASSDDSATQSLVRVARAANIEPPTEFSAKGWLANASSPWLLVIDSADNLREPIERYIPEGEMGCVIVTTRDPALRTIGMPGRNYLHFTELNDEEANDLLLRAADEPAPYTSTVRHLASEITKKLGCLPLALVHAGKAIVTGICRMHDYLTSFDDHWDRVRAIRSRRGSSAQVQEDAYTIIYSTYEITYRGLVTRMTPASEDALDLLKVFSFFHHENIRIEIFLQAAINPEAERNQQAKETEHERLSHVDMRPKYWTESLVSMGRRCYLFLVQLGVRSVLPPVLRSADSGRFDKYRLQTALQELSQMSLITHSLASDSYSMHPLIHTWVRERPESIAEQAVWCQAAATTLAHSILLPPLANTEADEDFRRDLLPHVDHVRKCGGTIQNRIASNQKRRRRPWPLLRPQMDRSRILESAKFAFIYAQCGLWHDAEILLTIGFDYLSKVNGMQDPTTIRVSLFLIVIYRQLDKLQDAAALQGRVLEACIALWGEDDLHSLEVTDALGVIRWQQGRFREAGTLHERAFKGFAKVKGLHDPDTLRAKGNIGRILAKNCKYDEATKIHLETATELTQLLGPSHQDTLSAMDDLAMSYLERSSGSATAGEDLPRAHTIILDVVERRKKKLGKDHPLTLWAIANLARVENARGLCNEAESRFRAALSVAERNLGPTHIGTLYGKTYLGYVLLCQERYSEAERLLVWVVKTFQESRRNHPDQVVTMSFLLKCYVALGQDGDAAKTRESMEQSLEAIGGSGHPREKVLFDVRIKNGKEDDNLTEDGHGGGATQTSRN
ncbi:MAG: hypothetical protein LQ346_007884 [Caloplaca aetnensis]|nr:MAG: hypothetical protein LQ346_007884 [Caloplaca aetnensis]